MFPNLPCPMFRWPTTRPLRNHRSSRSPRPSSISPRPSSIGHQSSAIGHRPFLLVLLAALIALAGCGTGPRRAGAVDPVRAREALRTTLDHWRRGEAPATLTEASPAITAQDLDWEAGFRLVNYEVLDDGRDDDANLRIPVALSLRDPRGRPVEKHVTYVVGTHPSTTVFREMN